MGAPILESEAGDVNARLLVQQRQRRMFAYSHSLINFNSPSSFHSPENIQGRGRGRKTGLEEG